MQGTFPVAPQAPGAALQGGHASYSARATPPQVSAALEAGNRGARSGKRLLDVHPDMQRVESASMYEQSGMPAQRSRHGGAGARPRAPGVAPAPRDPSPSTPARVDAARAEREEMAAHALVLGAHRRISGRGHSGGGKSLQSCISLARSLDMEYARHVAGASQSRSLASVWGPRDGTGLNPIDVKRLQDDLYEYITQRVDEEIEAHQGEAPEVEAAPEAEGTTPEAEGIFNLSSVARVAREEFNRGWTRTFEVGLVNEVVSAEAQVVLMLQKVGVVGAWDKIIPGGDPMKRARLLRRMECTSVPFALCVGSVVLNNTQTRPSVRPTKFVLMRSAADTALQFQALMRVVYDSRFELQRACSEHAKDPHSSIEIRALFIDYHSRSLVEDEGSTPHTPQTTSVAARPSAQHGSRRA